MPGQILDGGRCGLLRRGALSALRLAVLAAFAGALSACGPIKSTAFLLDAEVQIEAAHTAGADKLSPYEWTAANLYIHKAREEVGYSDFEAGVEYAGKASKFANEARDKAMAAARGDPGAGVVTPLAP
jgi:hypothetical protein